MRDYILPFLKTICGGLAVLASFIWGVADQWFYALLALIFLDYITGIIAALLKKELSSKIGFGGILKKLLFLVVVAVAHIIDTVIDANGVVRIMAIGFLISNEGISILENCGRCGLPIPRKLIEALEQLKNRDR